MSVEHFQNLVIGCGVAGKLVAWTLAKQGQKSIVVERSMVGGSCPNVACLPSKNETYSARAISLVQKEERGQVGFCKAKTNLTPFPAANMRTFTVLESRNSIQ